MAAIRDNEWFMAHVEREQSRLRAFIRRLGVRAEAVDDLAQDTLVVAFQKRDQFDEEAKGDFGAWVRGIARNLVANVLRKESHRRQILSRRLTEILLEAAPQQLHPLVANEDADGLSALALCVKELPDSSRHIVQLRYFDGLTPGAIADRLQRTGNDVRQMLLRIRRQLLRCVEGRLAQGVNG